jgi:pimeloyl-ACP methyl ester carboxylesterase
MQHEGDISAIEAARARLAAPRQVPPDPPPDVAVGPTVAATVLRLTDGRLLTFTEYGSPQGAPVLAFHGTPGSRLQLTQLDGPARRAGIRLVVPDRPGYGASDPHPRRRLVDWPADVRAIADHLRIDRFAVLGVSGGAPHALACALGLPRRVTRLAVVSGVAPPDCWAPSRRSGRLEQAVGLLMRTGGTVLRLLVAFALTLVRAAPGPALRLYRLVLPPADRRITADPAVLAGLRDEIRRQPRSTAASVVQDLGLFARPWGFDIGEVGVPTDVWHGDADRAVPVEHARTLAVRIPGAVLHERPGSGHFLLLERADEVLGRLAS